MTGPVSDHLEEMMALTEGNRLGSFQVHELLGSGAMGEVYRARDLKLGREVAIKVLPDGLSGDSGRLARFEQEARLLAALNHPHIATLFELGVDDGTRFLVMVAGARRDAGRAT